METDHPLLAGESPKHLRLCNEPCLASRRKSSRNNFASWLVTESYSDNRRATRSSRVFATEYGQSVLPLVEEVALGPRSYGTIDVAVGWAGEWFMTLSSEVRPARYRVVTLTSPNPLNANGLKRITPNCISNALSASLTGPKADCYITRSFSTSRFYRVFTIRSLLEY